MTQVRPAKVTVLPATKNRYTAMPIHNTRKRRVAAYARVSTDSDEQYTSYAAQVSYYTDYIKNHADWEFVDIYADEGITGTNTKKRDGFNRMIEDALAGKIDLIVTKSVSRFARNTVDSLTTVRKLKEHGVEVYFEKENIYTLDSKGELLITIMSSLAQEESRSISENVTWGQRKRFADGKVSMPYSHFLGYRKGENGLPEIVPEEAVVVRRIYRMFLDGKTPAGICSQLTSEGIPTPSGKTCWSTSTVLSILSNEKYIGDALLQKTFCTDFLTKKMKVNEGEVPQYYVENSHPAIISREIFEQVQQELERRKALGRNHRGTSIFAGKVVCGCCGDFFGSKVWHSNSPYRKVIWRCNLKYKGAQKCSTPHVTEQELMDRFLVAYNQLLGDRTSVVEDCQQIVTMLADQTELRKEQDVVLMEMTVAMNMMQEAIQENARKAMDQDKYQAIYKETLSRYEKAKERNSLIAAQLKERERKQWMLKHFMDTLAAGEVITEFSDSLWISMLDHVKIQEDGTFCYTFKDGTEIAT